MVWFVLGMPLLTARLRLVDLEGVVSGVFCSRRNDSGRARVCSRTRYSEGAMDFGRGREVIQERTNLLVELHVCFTENHRLASGHGGSILADSTVWMNF